MTRHAKAAEEMFCASFLGTLPGGGDRISGDAVNLEIAIDYLHKLYSRDRLRAEDAARVYALLGRFRTSAAHDAAMQAKTMLIVEPGHPAGPRVSPEQLAEEAPEGNFTGAGNGC